MEEDKKKKRGKTAAKLRLKKEMEADRRVRELTRMLASSVESAGKEEPGEQFPLYQDPEEILEDEKFKPSDMTFREKFQEWDGGKSLTSLCCSAAAFLLLCFCFGKTVSTRGGISFETALLGLCAVLFCLYGIGFGVSALRKKERRRTLGRAGLVLNGIFLAVFFGVYIIGVL